MFSILTGVQSLGVGLLYLPSYLPNLNRSERGWRLVKKPCLRAAYPDTSSRVK